MTRRRRGGSQKRRDQSSQQSIPYVFSKAQNMQRDLQSYTEKRRVRRKTAVTRRRKGGVKRGKSNLASNKFPKCSPQPGTPKEIHRVK